MNVKKRIAFDKARAGFINLHTTCHFLEEKAAQNLAPNFSAWLNSVHGCSVTIHSDFNGGFFTSSLSSVLLDIAVCTALKKIGFDSPCHTVGDMADGKLWKIPYAALMKFQEEHRKEILEWQERKFVNNFLDNPDFRGLAASRGKGAEA